MEEVVELPPVDPIVGVPYEEAKWLLDTIRKYRLVGQKVNVVEKLMGGHDSLNTLVNYLEKIVKSIDKFPTYEKIVTVETQRHQLRVSKLLRCYANVHNMQGVVHGIIDDMMRNPHGFKEETMVVPKKILLDLHFINRDALLLKECAVDYPELEQSCLCLERIFDYYTEQVVPVINQHLFTSTQIASAKHLAVELHGVKEECGFVTAVQRVHAFGVCLENTSNTKQVGAFLIESIKHSKIVLGAMGL